MKFLNDRETYVTDQVATWIENDGKYYPDAQALAYVNDLAALERYLVKSIRWAKRVYGAWHVGQELAPNDYGRISWEHVAARLSAK